MITNLVYEQSSKINNKLDYIQKNKLDLEILTSSQGVLDKAVAKL